jgi:hypothetical protein
VKLDDLVIACSRILEADVVGIGEGCSIRIAIVTLYVSLAFQLQPGDEDLERHRGDRVDFDGSDTVLENLGELGCEGFEEESVDLDSILPVLCAVVVLALDDLNLDAGELMLVVQPTDSNR